MSSAKRDFRLAQPNQLPKIDLTTFLLSISSAAFMGLGLISGDDSGTEPTVDLELARQNIDLLELIQEKTKGNRNAEEDRLIDELLFETRMRFVEIQRKTASK
jgi:hypothetical protein